MPRITAADEDLLSMLVVVLCAPFLSSNRPGIMAVSQVILVKTYCKAGQFVPVYKGRNIKSGH